MSHKLCYPTLAHTFLAPSAHIFSPLYKEKIYWNLYFLSFLCLLLDYTTNFVSIMYLFCLVLSDGAIITYVTSLCVWKEGGGGCIILVFGMPSGSLTTWMPVECLFKILQSWDRQNSFLVYIVYTSTFNHYTNDKSVGSKLVSLQKHTVMCPSNHFTQPSSSPLFSSSSLYCRT